MDLFKVKYHTISSHLKTGPTCLSLSIAHPPPLSPPTCQCDVKTHRSVVDVWAQASWDPHVIDPVASSWTSFAHLPRAHSAGAGCEIPQIPPTHSFSPSPLGLSNWNPSCRRAGASSTTPRRGPPLDGARHPVRVRNPSPISPSRSHISPSHSRGVTTLDRCRVSRTDASRSHRPSIYHWLAAQHWRQARRRGPMAGGWCSIDGQRGTDGRRGGAAPTTSGRRSTDGYRDRSPPTRRWRRDWRTPTTGDLKLLAQDLHHANNTTSDNKFVLLPPCSIDVEFCCALGILTH
jgi:hypothetical protein